MKINSSIKFSIIIPVYNVSAYLDQCINSVFKQKYRNYEVILVDDGSTDESSFICNRWMEKDLRIKVIHKENGGTSSARNVGIKKFCGDYVLFLDGDDYWLSDDCLEQIAQKINSTFPDVLIFNLRKDYDGRISKSYFSKDISISYDQCAEDIEAYIFNHELWTSCVWNKAICASTFEDGYLFFREGVTSEDIDWCYRLALRAETFDFLNLDVVAYRQRVSSVSNTMSKEKISCLLNNIKECLELSKTASERKRDNLKNYIAYQYGTLLYSSAMLICTQRKKGLLRDLKDMEYILEWSQHPKILLIRKIKNMFGLRGCLFLLAIKNNMDRLFSKRSK